MNYDEDPDPPNREADEWRKGYQKLHADVCLLRVTLDEVTKTLRILVGNNTSAWEDEQGNSIKDVLDTAFAASAETMRVTKI